MRKLKLFKSLLVVAMLLVGGVSSVWAAETPVWSVNFADVSTSTSTTISNFTFSSDYVRVGQDGWTYNSCYASETGEHFAWARLRSDSKTYGFCFRSSAVFCQSTSYAMTIIGLSANYKVTVVTSANGIASSFKGDYGGTWTESVNATNTEYTYTMSSAGDLNLMVAVGAYVYSVTVVEVSGLEATTYTVKYQNAGGTTLKTDAVYDTYVGETYTASAADMATFYNNDNSKKYVYKSGNTSTAAVATAASNVITLVFDEYDKIAYTVTAKNSEETLGTLASGDAYTDGSTTVYWNKFKQYDSKWYATTGSYGKTITETGNTDVAYSPSNIAYFFEAEELSTSRNGFPTASGTGYSGGSARRNYASGQMWTSAIAEGGVFTVTFPYSMANASESTIVIKTRDSGGNYTETGFSLTTNTAGTFSEVISIPAGSSLAICNDATYNSNILVDYVTLTKVNVPVTITSAGWATLYTDKALDFSSVSGLTAYTATCSGNTVTLTEVDDVPANTGVVLKGAADTYNIPVIASSTTEPGALEGNATAATAHDAFTGNDLYMLALNETTNKVQFTKATSGSIAAGKAYLKIAQTPARMLSVVFDDGDATGITNATAEMKAEDAIFNLAGQRVAQPANGLYIVNGKKVIVK